MIRRFGWSRASAAALVATLAASSPATVHAQPTGGLRSYDRSVLLEQEAAASANVSIGDLDGDGHLDIVLVKGRHWPLEDFVLRGDGTGGFEAHPLADVADRSYSGVLVDIDADGDLDVVISNDEPDPNAIYLNDGRGAFTAGSSFGVGEWPTRHVNVADVNRDGQPDIVVANRYGDTTGFNYVCINRGGGRFDAECTPFSSTSSTTITPADFDGDGDIDLAVPHREGGQSRIHLNDGRGGFEQSVAFGPPDAAIREAEAADLNGDGRLDIVAIDERAGPFLLMGRADGSFDAPRTLGSREATPYALQLADLNGDEHEDVIVGYVEARPVAFFNDGEGAFTPVSFGDAQGVAYGFATGDVDEDGVIDIAMARSDAPNVLYFGRADAQAPEPFTPFAEPALQLVNGPAFSPDGRTMYFALLHRDVLAFRGAPDSAAPQTALYTSSRTDDGWSAPELMPISGRYADYEPTLTADGTTLVFNSKRPYADGRTPERNDLWMSTRRSGGWSDPVRIDAVTTFDHEESYGTLMADGTLVYLRGVRGPADRLSYDLYWSRRVDGRYEPPLRHPVSTDTLDEGDPWIAPDGSWLIFTRWNGEVGWSESVDLFISFHEAGAWTSPVALAELNTDGPDYSPAVSPDGQWLYHRAAGRFHQSALAPILATYRARSRSSGPVPEAPLDGAG